PNTVQKAYQILESQGLIYSIPAKGSYVSPTDDGVRTLRIRAMKNFSESVRFALNCGIEKNALVEAISGY
ncbi:MAG: GntR family transcriptional regulator, partial [Oscillospiraceae bacterium]|nr:GntR family transcriptional regulator [Oscillospiraceae bacterium]